MSYNFNLLNRLNEAVNRTIDAKLWKSIASSCSSKYKNNLGVTAEPKGTRDELLQRFIAGLIILKQDCPQTEKDMRDCPAFTRWANKLLDMGVTMGEVHKLWNENCVKLAKVDTKINSIDNEPASASTPTDNEPIDDDDDIITGVSIEDDDDDISEPSYQNLTTNTVLDSQPEIEYVDEPDEVDNEEVIEEPKPAISRQQPTFKKDISHPVAPYNSDPYILINSIHTLLFDKYSQFPNLHGCSDPTEAMKFLPKLNASAEGINICENLKDLQNMSANIYALRVFRGGDPEAVQGDIVWCEATTPTSYYVGVSPTAVAIYYKDENGDFTLAWRGNHADFGFVNE